MRHTYGLLGKTLGHSFSPRIHSYLSDYSYELFSRSEEELDGFLEKCVKKEGAVSGLNVTIPYKEKVMPYCERLSPEAEAIGCVNTLVREKDGSLSGYNTDAYGLEYLAKHSGIDFSGKRVLILGTGGTSLTAAYVANKLGASRIRKVSRKGPLTYEMLGAQKAEAKVEVAEALASEIIINTTPAGMYPQNGEKLLDLSNFPCCEGVLDVIYNPFYTALLLQARGMGIPCANGLLMLVAQAKKSSELFTGEQISEDRTDAIYRILKKDLFNIVLVGMPGCGKSTIGRRLSELLQRPFLDTDEMVEEKENTSIRKIFETEGEEAFRRKETQAAREAGKQTGCVISTGGGILLRKENADLLRQNGKLFFIRRSLEKLPLRGGRPLSKDRAALSVMYEEREPLYHGYADAVIQNDGRVEDAVRRIIEEMER